MYPSSETGLIFLFIQAIFYGLYIATLLHCLRWLIFTDGGWKPRDKVNKLMLTSSVLIFILSTMNLGIALPVEFYSIGNIASLSIGGVVIGVRECSH